MEPCRAFYLGQVDYLWAWHLQQGLVQARQRGEAPDTILLLEHPPVYTTGTSGREGELRVPHSHLGAPLVATDRGGGITFHGPGQLLGYPIFRLGPRDIHQYVRDLEEVVIKAVARWGVAAGRLAGYPGVWVGQDKLCAIGLAVKGGVSCHGFALNISPDLSYFRAIVPCGLQGKGVTSLARLLDRPPSLEEVVPVLLDEMSSVFQRRVELGPARELGEACHV